MINEQFVKEYTPLLSKIAYLITRDQSKVEEIIVHTYQMFIADDAALRAPSKVKSNLIKYITIAIQQYYKSWYYQKLKLKLFFETNERFTHSSHHDDPSYAILKLPKQMRTVTTLYFYAELTSTEISKLLNLPQGNIQAQLVKAKKQMGKEIFEEEVGIQRKELDKYLGEWDEYTNYRALYIIDQLEHRDVKVANNSVSTMKRNLIGGGILALIIGAIAVTQLTNPTAELVDEAQLGIIQENPLAEKGKQQHFLLNYIPGSVTESNVIIPDDLSIEISKYETYYLNTSFADMELSELYAISDWYGVYANIYYLEKNNYVFDEEEIKKRLERAELEMFSLKMNPFFKEFLKVLEEEYLILEEDVMTYYVIPSLLGKYFLQEIENKRIGFTEDYYYSYTAFTEYQKIAGIDYEKLRAEYDQKMFKLRQQYKTVENLSELPFDTSNMEYDFVYDENGEIIIWQPRKLWYDFYQILPNGEMSISPIYELETQFGQDLNRLTIRDYIEFLEVQQSIHQYEGVSEIIEVYKIIEKSI